MAELVLKQELVESNTFESRGDDCSLLKCIVCKVVFKSTDKSYLLECLHPVCNSCLPSFVDVASSSSANETCPRQCPGCKVACSSQAFIENKFLSDLLLTQEIPDDLSDIKCSNHPETNATDWCDTCGSFICETCVIAHKHLKPTKDHLIKSKAEYMDTLKEKKPQRSLPCLEHPKEVLSVFCSTCNMMTCRDCQLTKHKAHDYVFLSEIANSTRETLQALKNEIESTRYQVDAQIAAVKEIESKIGQKKTKILHDVKDIVLRLTEAIRKKGTDLIMKVDEICQSKIREMSFKKDRLIHNLRQIEYCSNFVRNAVEIASDPVLVYSKEHVISHLNNVKENATSLQHLNLIFNMELRTLNVDEFVNVISNFAKIQSMDIVQDGKASANPETSKSPVDADRLLKKFHSPPLPIQSCPINPINQDLPNSLNYSFDITNQANIISPYQTQTVKQPQIVQFTPVVRFSPNGLISTLRHTHHNPQKQNYSNQPQPSTCAVVRENSSNQQEWCQTGGSWQNSLVGQSSNYRQVTHTVPAQNVIRIAASHQVTSTSNIYKPVELAFTRGPIVRIEPIPVSRVPVHPTRKIFTSHISVPQMSRPVTPNNMGQNRFATCRNYSVPPTTSLWTTTHTNSRLKVPGRRPVVPGVSWHIPQTETSRAQQPIVSMSGINPLPDASFKILLTKSKTPPTVPTPTSVSSSDPEIPLPNPQNRPDVAEALDTLCQASLDDVLRTLSDLDKNIDNGAANKRDSVVHSSTGSTSNSESGTPQPVNSQKNAGEWQKEDPNEDWCAVCMDGGELVCCDHCPKVFHINCHIPALSRVPQEIWQCSLCRDVSSLPYAGMEKHSKTKSLTQEEQSVCERILLELYCQYDCSLHFREPVPPENTEYHKVIQRPMCFDIIRRKLTSPDTPDYSSVREFISDIRLVFKNAFTFNPIGSQVYADGMTLEEFLESLLTKFLPLFAHTNLHDDMESDDDEPIIPLKKTRRIIPD